MPEWLIDIAGPDYASGVLWTFAALALLVLVLLVVKLIRGMTFGTYVAGGRNRKTRLAVMDATAVDSHRRLVLVRRDDVEHLILIGGPTDVVVEQNIHLGQTRRPAPPPPLAAHPQQQGQQAARPPRPPQPAMRPQPAPGPRPVPAQPAAPRAAPQPPAPPVQPVPPAAQPPHQAVPARAPELPKASEPHPAPAADDLDYALVSELTLSLDEPAPAPAPSSAPKTAPTSIEDEMNRLLGELAAPKR